MKENLASLHNALYDEKSQNYMFLALCTTVFVYGFMYRAFDLRITFWCSLPFVLYFCFEQFDKRVLDTSFLLISTFSLIIAVIAYTREPELNTYWSDVKVAWIFPTIYMLGVASVGHNVRKADKRIFYVISSLNFGMFFQAILDHINKIFRPYNEDVSWFAFWKDDYEVRTVFEFGFMLMVGTFYFALKNKHRNKIFFVVVTMNTVISIIISLVIRGRTVPCMFVLIFLICLLLDIFTSFNSISKKVKRFIILFFVGIIIVVILGAIAIKINIGGFGDAYIQSFWARDGGIRHNVRIQVTIDSLIQAFSQPEGGWYGSNLLSGGGSHNTWLEFARYYNTFIFMILVMYLFVTIFNLFKSIIEKNTENSVIKYYITGAFSAFFIYLTLEPVGASPSYYYIIFFIFVSGIVNRKSRIACEL